MAVHGIYISKPHPDGFYYIAERPRCGRRLLWSMLAADLNTAQVSVEATIVPRRIRRAAYRWLGEKDEQVHSQVRADRSRKPWPIAAAIWQTDRSHEAINHPLRTGGNIAASD